MASDVLDCLKRHGYDGYDNLIIPEEVVVRRTKKTSEDRLREKKAREESDAIAVKSYYEELERQRNLEAVRKAFARDPIEESFKKRAGIGFHGYCELWKKQKGCCAICGVKSERQLLVDHDHKTGKIRGLLCRDCNVGLGYFRDSKESLKKAIKYLAKNAPGN